MKTFLLTIILLATASEAGATGLCTGDRECPMTMNVVKASDSWHNCVADSIIVQIKRTDDLNAAAETALAACTSEEDALFSAMIFESHLTPEEVAKLRSISRAQWKANTLDIIRNGPSSRTVRGFRDGHTPAN